MDSLNANFPVSQPDNICGNYEWMSIRAGQDSSFSKKVEVCGELDSTTIINVQTINGEPYPPIVGGGGELPQNIDQPINCDEDEVVPAGTELRQAVRLISDYFCENKVSVLGGNLQQPVMGFEMTQNSEGRYGYATLNRQNNFPGDANYDGFNVILNEDPARFDGSVYDISVNGPFTLNDDIPGLGFYSFAPGDYEPKQMMYIPFDHYDTNSQRSSGGIYNLFKPVVDTTELIGDRIRLADTEDINNNLEVPLPGNGIRSQEGRPLAFYIDEPGVYRLNYKICMVDFEGDGVGLPNNGGDGDSGLPKNTQDRGFDFAYEINDTRLMPDSDLNADPPIRGRMVGTSLGSTFVLKRDGTRPDPDNYSRFPTYLGQSSRGNNPGVLAKNIPNEIIEKGQIFKFDAMVVIEPGDLIDHGDGVPRAKLNIKIRQAFIRDPPLIDPLLVYVRYFYCSIIRVSSSQYIVG